MIKPILLNQPYLTKKIKGKALKTALNSSYQTVYRLYMISNAIKELQHFIKLEHPDLWVIGTIKTEAAPTNNVKQQVWAITHLRPILEKKPKYILKCHMTKKSTNKIVYRCKFTSIKPNLIYKQIQQCINEITHIIDEKNY